MCFKLQMTTYLKASFTEWISGFFARPRNFRPRRWLTAGFFLAALAGSPLRAGAQDATRDSLDSPAATAPAGGASGETERVVVNASDLDATRNEIAPSLGAVFYTIGPNQIESTPQGENASFNQVLLRAPGVVQDSYGEEHVRGEHGGLTYRLNGVLLPEGLNGFGQDLDTRIIGSVTLIDGTLPAQFGFRTAGIVDVETKSGDALKNNEFSIQSGSYDTFIPSLQLGGTEGKFDYFVSLSYRHDDLGIENPVDTIRPLHDYTDQEKGFAYLAYKLDATSRVSLLLSASDADFEIPDSPGLLVRDGLGDRPSVHSSTVNENQNEQNYYAVLSYQKNLSNLFSQVSVYSRYGRIHFTPDDTLDLLFQGLAGEVKNSFFTNGLQFDSSYFLNEHHTIRFGLLGQYTIENLDTNTRLFDVDATGALLSITPRTIIDNTGLNGVEAGVYLQDEWHPLTPLTINYGARFDRFDSSFDHEGQLSPRINAVYQFDAATSAHLGYSRYFAPPTIQYVEPKTLDKFAGTTNAPDNFLDTPTKVERSHYFDVGVSRQFTPGLHTTLDAYLKLARNLGDLGQFGDAVILTPFSYRSGHVEGVELSNTYAQGPFSAFLNFSFVDTSARDINSAQYQFPNDELAYIATHDIKLDHTGEYSASAGASYTWLGTRFNLDLLYGYGLRSGFANTDKEPSYVTVNPSIEHVFHPHLRGIKAIKARVDCINLFDNNYQLRNGSGLGITAAQYGERRTVLGTVSVDF